MQEKPQDFLKTQQSSPINYGKLGKFKKVFLIILSIIFLFGIYYAVFGFFNSQSSIPVLNINPTSNQGVVTLPKPKEGDLEENTDVSIFTISYAYIRKEIYLKSEIVTYSTNGYYSEETVIMPDIEYLNPEDDKWNIIVTEPVVRTKGYGLTHEQLFNFKVIPNSNILFFVAYRGEGTTIYTYDLISTVLKQITFAGDGEYPYIHLSYKDPFSLDGRYVSIDLHDCSQCDGGRTYKLLLDIPQFTTKFIREVSQFSWKNNGNYEYKDYVLTKCSTNELTGQCPVDPDTLPLKTGKIQ